MPFYLGLREVAILVAVCILSGYGLAIFSGFVFVRLRLPFVFYFGPGYELISYLFGQVLGFLIVVFIVVGVLSFLL